MSGWSSKSLGDGLTAWEPLGRLEALFLAEYAKAGCPRDMAVFIRHESEGRLHCDVRAYFSPAAVAVASELEADPCEAPAPDGLDLFLGDADAWHVLFPEHPGREA